MGAGPILVTGGGGQLARALDAAAPAWGLEVARVGRPEFDFDRPESLASVLVRVAPRLVVNAAAYTAVDAAEDDAEAAFRANAEGPARLAALAASAGIPLIHVSTDYVFDGLKGAPYVETDPVSPQGVYGASKLEGERAVLGSGARAVILRTSWVYAAEGRNFVRTMLAAAARTGRLRVVADQLGCPTEAGDLAGAILGIIRRLDDTGWRPSYGGVFHAAGTGAVTWHGFAEAIFAAAARHGLGAPVVEPITTADWPTKARRPPDSRLDCGKLSDIFDIRLPEWMPTLSRTIDTIFSAR
jgi:dTDP-4-dehydrorhamnose reductase